MRPKLAYLKKNKKEKMEMNQNLIILKEERIKYPFIDQVERIKIFKQIAPQVYRYPGNFEYNQILEFKKLNFNWFVNEKFVERLAYAANLRWRISPVVEERIKRSRFSSLVGRIPIYQGDLPLGVIPLMEELLDLNIYNFTIHSCYPLEIKYLEKTDPILIGWKDSPVIKIDINRNERKVKCRDGHLGIVVAAWDIDKEMNFLTSN